MTTERRATYERCRWCDGVGRLMRVTDKAMLKCPHCGGTAKEPLVASEKQSPDDGGITQALVEMARENAVEEYKASLQSAVEAIVGPDHLVKIDDGQSVHVRTAREWLDLARASLRSSARLTSKDADDLVEECAQIVERGGYLYPSVHAAAIRSIKRSP